MTCIKMSLQWSTHMNGAARPTRHSLSHTQTAGWSCRSGHNRHPCSLEARVWIWIPPSLLLLLRESSGRRITKLPRAAHRRQMPATRPNGRWVQRGMTWLQNSSHAPWHVGVTPLRVLHRTAAARVHCPSALGTQRQTPAPQRQGGGQQVEE